MSQSLMAEKLKIKHKLEKEEKQLSPREAAQQVLTKAYSSPKRQQVQPTKPEAEPVVQITPPPTPDHRSMLHRYIVQQQAAQSAREQQEALSSIG